MLNSTLCATSRAVCVVLETHQTETGVHVPEVLRPYMGGLEFLPFKREAPKREEAAAPAAKGSKPAAAAAKPAAAAAKAAKK